MRAFLPESSGIPVQQTLSADYRIVSDLLRRAGISMSGENAWDMKLHDASVPREALTRGNLGLGEAYMAGSWDAEQLDQFFYKLLRSRITDNIHPLRLLRHVVAAKLFNRQSVRRAKIVGNMHYDLGNDFYEQMLDSRLTYTCGYWANATDLEQAQEAKLDLICRKLCLKPGMSLLDIGCGWGSLMAYAAEHYGVRAVGVSISREQVAWAKSRYQHLPLEFHFEDYRNIGGTYDAIASVGMFEHVGRKNFGVYMDAAHRVLKQDGLFLLHTIGKNVRNTTPDPWIDKYIFPNGDLPSIGQIGDALDGLFRVEDLHNFGADYDRTLMSWFDNFDRSWPMFADRLGPTFYRMWKYYLLSCAGAFRARDIQLWQWVLSKDGVPGGYRREEI